MWRNVLAAHGGCRGRSMLHHHPTGQRARPPFHLTCSPPTFPSSNTSNALLASDVSFDLSLHSLCQSGCLVTILRPSFCHYFPQVLTRRTDHQPNTLGTWPRNHAPSHLPRRRHRPQPEATSTMGVDIRLRPGAADRDPRRAESAGSPGCESGAETGA